MATAKKHRLQMLSGTPAREPGRRLKKHPFFTGQLILELLNNCVHIE
jgi:hypothetical protein